MLWLVEPIGCEAVLQQGLGNISGSGGVILFDNNPTLNYNTTMADLNQASFDGYTPGSLGFGFSYTTPVGGVRLATYNSFVQFTAGAAIVSVTIYGYAVTSAFLDLYWVEDFAVPIVLDTPGQSIIVVPRISLQSIQTV